MASFPLFDDPNARCAADDDDEFDEFMMRGFASQLGFAVDENLFAEAVPDAGDWRDQSDDVSAGVDVARERAWNQADLEFKNIKKQFYISIPNEEDENAEPTLRKPTVEELLDRFFGETSPVFVAFKRRLNMSHAKFQQFLGTFYYTCGINMSLSDVTSEKDMMEGAVNLLMSQAEYMTIWKQISAAGLPKSRGDGTTTGRRGYVEFWREVEDTLNTFLRENFIQGFEGRMMVTVDDDKMHHQSKTGDGGPKLTQHVRDNRRGYTCHQAVLSASLVLVGARCDGRGDTTATSTEKLMKNQLAPAEGNSENSFGDTSFYFDRGYMTYGHLTSVVKWGGDIESATLRRQRWNPFTYDQKIGKGDNRTEAPTDSAKNLLRKEIQLPGGKMATSHAYCNGNGGVTLGLSTAHRQNEWDFVLKNPADRELYNDEEKRQKMWY